MSDLLAPDWTTKHAAYRLRLKQEPEQIVKEHSWTCPFCDRYVQAEIREYDRPFSDGTLTVPVVARECGCEAEIKHLRQVQERQDRKEAEWEWSAAMERAGLVGWFADVSFDTYTARDDWKNALQCLGCVRSYAYALMNGNLDGKPFLILHGGYGTGKSHLAAALVHHVLSQGWRQVYFRVWPEYLDRIKASWSREKRGVEGESEEDIAYELQKGRLVVIDDLDKQPPTDWAKKTLYTVLNKRYNDKAPTVLTFNYGPDDIDMKAQRLALVEYLGEAVLDRLIGDAFDVVEFAGPSYRSGVQWRAA